MIGKSLLASLHRRGLKSEMGERTESFLGGLRWMVPATMTTRLISGCTTMLATRWMGPQAFGEANLSLAASFWVQIPLLLGIPTALMHYGPQAHGKQKGAWILSGLGLLFLAGGITLAVGYAFDGFWGGLQGISPRAFDFCLIWCAGFLIMTAAGSALSAVENFRIRSYLDVGFALLYMLCIVAGRLKGGVSGDWYILSLSAGMVIAGAVGLAVVSRSLHNVSIDDARRHVSVLLIYGLIASFGNLASALLNSPARLIANRYLPLAAVGLLSAYQAASVQMASLLAASAMQVFFPIASRTPDKRMLFWKIHRAAWLSAPALFAAFLALMVFYFKVLGRHYTLRSTEAMVFCAAAVFTGFQAVYSFYFFSLGRRGMISSSIIALFSGAINILVCLWLIPSQTILGAGWALLVASAAGLACYYLPPIRRLTASTVSVNRAAN